MFFLIWRVDPASVPWILRVCECIQQVFIALLAHLVAPSGEYGLAVQRQPHTTVPPLSTSLGGSSYEASPGSNSGVDAMSDSAVELCPSPTPAPTISRVPKSVPTATLRGVREIGT